MTVFISDSLSSGLTHMPQPAVGRSATALQKVYRGHLGRKVARKWRRRRREIDASRALFLASSVAIQRVYRGHQARGAVQERRKELVSFILSLRLKEMQEEEELYWQTNSGARKIRQLKERYCRETKQSAICVIG